MRLLRSLACAAEDDPYGDPTHAWATHVPCNAEAEAAALAETSKLNAAKAMAERMDDSYDAQECNDFAKGARRMREDDLASHWDAKVAEDDFQLKVFAIYCDVLRQRGKGDMIHGG